MKKKKEEKTDWRMMGGIGLIAIALVFAFSATAEFSFKDLVAKYTGDALAPILAEDIDLDGDEIMFSAFPGPDVYADIKIHGSLTTGSGTASCFATSTTNTSEVFLAKDFDKYPCFLISGEDDGMTLTMPATSTFNALLPNRGDKREWWINFATTTTATLTIAEGSGIDLIGPSANDDVIDNGETAKLTCIRYYLTNAVTDVTCIIEENGTVD